PVHIDVRDAHLTTCPSVVPAAVCVLLGLEGLAPSASSAQGTPPAASSPLTPVPQPSGSPSGPPSLLDLLPKLPLLGPSSPSPQPGPSSTPGGLLGGLLERIGGSLNHVFGWLI
ncbi:MAG TPA: hypothetical protein VJ818_08730, partial [Actinomycetota bacterium]|nr:hypothetical protein [Actinomycetota bacterium]